MTTSGSVRQGCWKSPNARPTFSSWTGIWFKRWRCSETSREMVRTFLSSIAGEGIQVIAEGIETEHEAEVCLQSGCDLGQGFLYGHPTSFLEVIASLGEASRLSRSR